MSSPITRFLQISAGLIWLAAPLGTRAAVPASVVPDFAPNGSVGWIAFAPAFIPPTSGPGPVRNDPAHPRVGNDEFRASGAQPTFPMADLENPILQPWVKERLGARKELILSGKPAFPPQASCWPTGVPGFLLYPVQPVYFVQTPKEVLMIWQADHQVRRVYLNAEHSAPVKPSWYGESIGHYEGDTLVVDTVGLDTRTRVDNFQTPHTDRLHVVERFHIIDAGKTLEVNLTVEDTGAFTMPWNAIQRYHRVEPGVAENNEPFNPVSSSDTAGPMLEASCAENPDVSLFGEGALPIPTANKPDF
jgi:hypothetical protein